MAFAVGDQLSGRIEGYAFGGEGILRHEGFVIFVPFTIRGEVVLVKIKERKRHFARADLIELLTPSEERKKPFCPYHGKCGGCQLQHMSHQEQLFYKENAPLSALRILKESPSCSIASSPPYRGWREKITLHLTDEPECRLAYRGENPLMLIPVSYCPIFLEEDSSLFKELEVLLNRLPQKIRKGGRLTLVKGHSEHSLAGHSHSGLHLFLELDAPNPAIESFVKGLERSFASFAISTKKNKKTYGWQSPPETRTIEGLKCYFDPSCFQQNHFALSQKLYRETVAWISAKKAKKVLDLYSGSGILSLLLWKKGIEVVSCEASKNAVLAAKKTLLLNPNSSNPGPLIFSGLIEKKQKELFHHGPYQAVILNPPRQGLSPSVRSWVGSMHPPCLIYISCMPPTLARDLQHFQQLGYRIEALRIYDLFPQTAHMETVAFLTR